MLDKLSQDALLCTCLTTAIYVRHQGIAVATSITKSAQVTARMRALIAENHFENGRLPSEPELSHMLEASRATVRQALSSLAEEGLLIRRHGIGTFVNERVLNIPTRLEEVWDFAEMIQLSGYTPGVQHIELTLGPASEMVARQLALDPESPEVITTANVFLADAAPAIYCIDMIPAHLVNQAYRDEELHGPVYAFLEKRCGQRLSHNIAEILPVVADVTLADLLQCPVGSALHFFREPGFNQQGTAIIYSEEYYRPDFFSFSVIRKKITSMES